MKASANLNLMSSDKWAPIDKNHEMLQSGPQVKIILSMTKNEHI